MYILYIFRAAMCPSSGELSYQCDTWFMSLCVDDRVVCRSICSCKPAYLQLTNLKHNLSYMFISILYVFRAAMCHHQENYCISATSGLCHYVDDRLVCRSICSCIPDGHLHKVTQTRCRTDTIILLMMGTWLPETCREYT